jgi:hypothetical protein
MQSLLDKVPFFVSIRRRIPFPPPPKSLESTTFSRLFFFLPLSEFERFGFEFSHFSRDFRKIKSPENPCCIRVFGTLF